MNEVSDEKPLSSPEQDQWIEIADAVRKSLHQRCKNMPSMQTGELVEFVQALNDARWFDMQARVWDAQLADQRRQAERTEWES